MAKQKPAKQQERRELTDLERLGLRISSMINAPKAQLERWVTIHRLDTDTDEAWGGVMELLRETDGLEMAVIEDGVVELRWHQQSDDDHYVGDGEIEAVEEEAVA
ncbi:DUF1654 domain-containing protein [Pseudomonas sp. MAP12]|uniref:DUF1654 domain-containing protein n=1 Tax=Geopseudomonas aromaticivorans TaxID=2849492 RepID=A0ABS6MT86_9GAMM|nr:DUF1654 domain-containing protein [Pseudomonas aromaticivorans]MBV2132014.1 DUF1654 domain-containing protein [Pseudomonas aromaticivorans]